LVWNYRSKNKYGAVRVKKSEDTDGYSFASAGEFALYRMLKLRVSAGEIKDLKVQDTCYLTRARIIYKPDYRFAYTANDETAWAEYKGFFTDAFNIKLNLWRYYGPGKLELWIAGYKGPKLKEIITPRTGSDEVTAGHQ
jgi:hypothetical protein